jgi:hypothetical protein
MAEDNVNSTSLVKVHPFTKGMVKDIMDTYAPPEIWRHARNAINTSHDGEKGGIGNEQSNELCSTAPFDVIGITRKSKHEWVVFSTNDTDSEIGIFNEFECAYTTIVNNPCLGFKKTNVITAVTKKNYDTTYSVYFQDNLNYDRVLNLDKVPYKLELDGSGNPVNASLDPDCFIPVYTTDLDCDKLKLHPLVKQPCLTLKKGQGTGQLINGSYQAAIAYSENGIRLTDYSIPTEPQPLWEHGGIGGSLDLFIDDLDLNFEEYELVIIAMVNQQTIVKKIGYYSIRQNRVHIDLFNQDLETVNLAHIPLRSIVYERSEKMFKVNDYLVRTGVTAQPYINYQPLANEISSEWVAVEYPADYYRRHGRVTGYMRDEVYSFFIRFVYATGARTASYHIPGRAPTGNDRLPVSGDDVVYPNETQRWQVYDTATRTTGDSSIIKDGGRIAYTGKMAYWQSTEKYPNDQPLVWGDLCGKQIRHHKMPSNETIGIHDKNGTVIYVLGVKFTNIKHPRDDQGNMIPDIVGYEILRGSREGNRTIVAKGLFNNMWEYNIVGSPGRKGLYQNYPFNDLRPDDFLTTDATTLEPDLTGVPNIENATRPSIYKRNYFSFHAPENNLVKPYVNANYIKIYSEETGTVTGQYKVPYKHPKHKLISNFGALTAAFIGAGIGVMAAMGPITTSSNLVAGTTIPATFLTESGASTQSGPATILTDLPVVLAKKLAGVTTLADAASLAAGIGFMLTYSTFFAGQGMDTVLDIIHKISNYRDYAVQYNSHGFYNRSNTVRGSSAPSGVYKSIRRGVDNNGAKYIGSVLQDFDPSYKINNINREKFLAVKTLSDVPVPANVDNTRVTIRQSGLGYKNPFNKEIQTQTSAYYGAIKVDYQNQYGQLDSIIQLPTDSCVLPIYPTFDNRSFFTPVIFGGDIYINRYTEKNPYFFFNAWQYGEPDGSEFNYRNYLNGPIPRYWADFSKYDTSDLRVTVNSAFPFLSIATPSDLHRLDKPSFGTGVLIVNRGYFYLFCNSVRDFFVESELNIAFRDFGEEDYEKYYDPYGEYFTDLDTMFRSDLIKKRTYYKYDLSLSSSKLYYNFGTWGTILPADYDPETYNDNFTYYPGRAIYSLQQQVGLKRDNWRNFLALNYKDFNGRITSIKELNATGAIILFENHEPVMFAGVDQLQTEKGVKITIGDGGLFQQNMQAFVNADDELQHGSCISMRSAVNTPYGLFFVSQQTGKVLQYANGLVDVSSRGMRHWFNEHLPSKLLKQFPNYDLYDNPVAGTAVQGVYDSQYDLLYFTKRDYQCKDPDMKYEPGYGFYKERTVTVSIDGDPQYTCPEGYTLVEGDLPGSYVCRKVTSVGATFTPTTILTQPVSDAAWGWLGTAIYDTGWNTNGTGAGYNPASPSAVGYTLIPFSNSFWYKAYSTSSGIYNTNPVNRIGIWSSSNPELVGVYGFEYNICITEAKTYYVALAGDNTVLLKLNGQTILDFDPSQMGLNHVQAPANVEKIQYTRLHIYPLVLQPGNYLLQLLGNNFNGPGMIGAEIYDNTVSEIAAATSYSDLNVVFTTRGKTQFTSNNYVCPEGYSSVLNEDCESVSCRLIEEEEPTVLLPPFEVDVIVRDKYYVTDTRFFDECSWTVSYDPIEQYWVSFHDWKPRWLFSTTDHFITIPDRSFWRHNRRWDSFTSYYNNQEGWEIDFEVMTQEGVTTLRSVEYMLEMYKYYSPLEKHHVLDENFDRAIIYNSEQTSGILFLNIQGKNNPLQLLQYPIINTNYIDILYSKEENKYRFNQFWDITRDRGEFTNTKEPIWYWECNGVDRRLNATNLNYRKLPLQRKKFRHYRNNVVLIKQNSSDRKMILKLFLSKNLYSPR